MGIKRRETATQPRQNIIRKTPNHPQRMIQRHTLLQTNKTEKLITRTRTTTHPIPPQGEKNQSIRIKTRVLQQPALMSAFKGPVAIIRSASADDPASLWRCVKQETGPEDAG